MAFNEESEFLNLNKVYLHFEYQSLVNQQVILCEFPDEKAVYEGMTQNTYLFVTQKATLIKDIDNLSTYFIHKYVEPIPNIRPKPFNQFPFQKIKDRVCYIFQKYQEQPSLLDGILEEMITPTMNGIKQYLYKQIQNYSQQQICDEFHQLLSIIYQLTKVRGMVYTSKYFPHEVKDLEPAINYLVKSQNQAANWESRYIILLWLTVIILVPFDLITIDSKNIEIYNEKGQKVQQMVEILLQISKFYLKSTTKLKEAAAVFLSKLFTRPDIQKRNLLKQYIEYTLQNLKYLSFDNSNTFFVVGLYESLHQIFKNVNRNQLLPFISGVLHQIREELKNQKENPAKKLIKIQLLTSIGLVYLKPRVAKWAYKKNKISLKDNLKSNQKITLISNISNQTNTNTVDNFGNDTQNQLEYYKDVNKVNLEQIIDLLIEALGEKQTSIREAASKGIGKISGRLSSDMILDLLDYIFNLNPSPQTQHSICLTLAELIRRNLLSPEKLQSLYPFISESLLYEKEEGGYSIGQAVRDSACYMTWAVARGYEEGGKELGIYLMIAACFDRQVGCRRAASAAYQQLVGRVGDVPNGIEVLTEADYFTLGLQKNSYLNVGIFVSSFEPYFKPFAQNLGYQKLRHWDIDIKKIAACSLSLMCPINPQFMATQLLPSLVNYLEEDIMNVRLGSIIGIGQILIGLNGKSHEHQVHDEMKDSVFLKSLTQNQKKLMNAGQYMTQFKQKYEQSRYLNNLPLVNPQVFDKIIRILKSFIEKNIYKGKVGEVLRLATCRLIQCIAMVNIPLKDKQIELFNNFIEDNVKNPLQTILNAAVKCLKRFSAVYHIKQIQQPFVKLLIKNSKLQTPQAKGYTLALSALSYQVYKSHINQILQVIEENTKILKEKEDDADKRKNAIIIIRSLIESIGFNNNVITQQILHKLWKILERTINDYSTDKRGDIGSIVREASMKTFSKIIELYCQTPNKTIVLENELVYRAITHFLQQLSQKIDRIRLLSGSLLQRFFDNHYKHFTIPEGDKLQLAFKQDTIRQLIKNSQLKFDQTLEPEVMQMEMKIQQSIFQQKTQELIFYWNLPHFVFNIIVPFLQYKQYSYSILKGLCTSTGGISQSVIKYSRQQLNNYINKILNNQEYQYLDNLLQNSILILQKHYRDERIINPMYNTLDFLFENEEIMNWEGFKKHAQRLLDIMIKQIGKSKMIIKIASGIGLFTHLLSLGDQTLNNKIIPYIIKYLSSDLPKVRKILADKLLLVIMSQNDSNIFNEQQSQELMILLQQTDFMDEKMDRKEIEQSLCRILKAQSAK